MAAFVEIQDAILKHFKDGWTDGAAERTPISWPNREFTPPASGLPWVRIELQETAAGRDLITGQRDSGQKHVGLVMIQVFIKAGSGTRVAKALADQVDELFRETRLSVAGHKSKIAFSTPKLFIIGKSQGSWWQENIVVPLEFTENPI
jgi:hypothetical protein